MKDQVVLMYVKNDTLYPVALTEEQHHMLQSTLRFFNPLTIVQSEPQGQVVNLFGRKKGLGREGGRD
ncbi:hypothetical protein SAMN05192559_10475 [Halobacillus karajensis]|uniref:hypothetical protein n=1 Tax=Halobacillus karajensis TaxID=195088 RepID=UPI0008A73EE5|nr:hypothetical protein [Halobacillus karajensis]SEH77995.1 hypothetical protein SAMN05192559_10475 [Halobacillus karajensis]